MMGAIYLRIGKCIRKRMHRGGGTGSKTESRVKGGLKEKEQKRVANRGGKYPGVLRMKLASQKGE